MSTRTELASLPSIEPLKQVVGSGNEELAAALMQSITDDLIQLYGEDEIDEEEHEEYQSMVEEMIINTDSPSDEAGSWQMVIRRVVAQLNLDVEADFSFNHFGFKHYYCWHPYRKMLTDRLSEDALQLLRHLEEGRPLKGKRVHDDGSLFGWLEADEVKRLHHELDGLDEHAISVEELNEFHEQLIECLAEVAESDRALLLTAN